MDASRLYREKRELRQNFETANLITTVNQSTNKSCWRKKLKRSWWSVIMCNQLLFNIVRKWLCLKNLKIVNLKRKTLKDDRKNEAIEIIQLDANIIILCW